MLYYRALLLWVTSKICWEKKEVQHTSRNKFHDWLEKTIEQTTEAKDNNPETIEVRVFKNE